MVLSVQNASNVLLLVDIEDGEYLDIPTKSDRWNIVSEVLDFNNLHASVEQIGRLADANDIDFLLYSQNEQVGKRCAIGAVHQHVYIASPPEFDSSARKVLILKGRVPKRATTRRFRGASWWGATPRLRQTLSAARG